MTTLEAGDVVIGSGPGGAITAAVLAEAGRDVLVLEEGPPLGLGSCPPFGLEEMVQKYRNRGMTVGLGRPKVAYVEGCVAGGGSEINSGLYHRPPADALARWRSDWKVAALDDALLEPLAARNERDLSVQCIPGDRKPPASLKLHRGATRLGWKSLEVPRWFTFDGTCDAFGVPRGTRQSMSRTFLPRLLRAGGRLETGTRVDRFERSGSGWLVRGRRHGRPVRIRAGRLFLCAGAVQTPFLLRRSGIVAAVGNRLLVHPTVKVVAHFPDVINGPEAGVGVHQVKQFSPRVSLGCSIGTKPHLALAMLDHPDHAHLVDGEWTRMAVYYAMVSGGGHGTVRALPGCDDPVVRYRVDRQGRRDLAAGLHAVSRALLAAGAAEVFPGIAGFGPPLRDEADLVRIPAELPVGRTQLMTIHLLGSCPMGEAGGRAPCDSFGRVKGHPGLAVNDASLICDSPGVNPQGTVMLLARRNALHHLGSL
jgi:choline dehydrogenase-like flavoprotein